VNVALKIGQRLFGAFGPGLSLEQENGQGAEQRQITRRGGVTHGATVLVLSSIPAIVQPIFDAPVIAVLSGLAESGPATQTTALGMVEAVGKLGNGVRPFAAGGDRQDDEG
jgi:hypothetical protein